MTALTSNPFTRILRAVSPAFLTALALLLSGSASAQVSVTATAGTPGPTPYANVGAAFTSINAGTHQGDITIGIIADTAEPASAILNASGSGAALYTSVMIQPVGGPRVITGSVVGAIIKLNGADNVTIDGRLAGAGRNLTVANSSVSAATAAIWLSSLGVGLGATNNTIRNLEIACGATQNTLTATTVGILMSGLTVSVTSNGDDNDNNAFIANRIIRARYGIVTRGQAANNNINPIVTDNIIGPAAFGPDEIGKTAILMQSDTGAIVSRNTIQFVGSCLLAQTCTTGADRVGIGIGSEAWSTTAVAGPTAGDYTVTKNVIHDIVEERTFSAVGILAGTTRAGLATNNLIANNFIYNIRANATPGDQVVGIGVSGGHTDRIIHNSIAITGDMDPGAAAASSTYGNAIRLAAASSAAHANLTLADNSIFMDVNSNTATLPFFAITVNSAAYSFGTGLMNNNNLFVNLGNLQMNTGGLSASSTAPTGATLFNTLAQWQTALTTPQDAASIQLNPLYNSNTADLHISGASPNLETALNLALADDIDGQPRPNGPNPDIGADEFYPTPGTVQFSSAAYSATEGGLTATITVTRTGGSSGAASVNYATVAGGSAIGGAACGGPVDAVDVAGTLNWANNDASPQTFVVTICNDGAPESSETVNFALSGAVTATLGTPNVATLTIQDTTFYSGFIFVGTTETFTSLTNPGGIFEILNNGGLSGNLVLNITSDLAGETGAVALNQWLEQGAGGYTLTLKPRGAPRTITGSAPLGLITLNGADRVTIEGSIAGGTAGPLVGGDPLLRELTINNTNVATSSAVISIVSGTSGAVNDTVRNVNIVGQDPVTTLAGIAIGGASPGSVGLDSDNARVENCSFRKSVIGIYTAGQSAANPNLGTVITRNDMTGTLVNRLRRAGILVFNQDGVEVSYNAIGGIDTNESIDAYGIGLGIQDATVTQVTGGGVTNAAVFNNRIDGIASTTAIGFSAFGIGVSGGTPGANTIYNNMISGITAPATAPDLVAGIFVAGAAGSTTRVLHNSVSLTGDRGAVANQVPGFGLAVSGSDPAVTVKDNIFHNIQTSGGGVNAKSYAVGLNTASFVNLDANFNDYYSAGANAGFFRTGSLAAAAGADYATLPLWRAAISDDAASLFADPLIVSATDLHLQGCAGSPAGGAGTPVPGVTTDFDGNARSAINPDIGADETGRMPVTASAGANGTITPSGLVPVSCGGNQLFTLTPAPGYTVLDLLLDGGSVGAPLTYNLLSVIAPHTLAASFRTNVGAVPDRLSLGTPLTIAKNTVTPSNLDLIWGDSCGAAQSDFAVYEGTLGTWYSHGPKTCSTAGAFSLTNITPAAGSAYYLIVPLSATTEGSYGTDSSGVQIPKGTGACFVPSDTSACS